MNAGKQGEEIALKYLEEKGFKLVAKNYRYDRAETDLIVKDDGKKLLLFAEVKTRTSNKFAEPEDSISETKQYQMYKSAEGFLFENEQYEEYEKRFDVISIVLENQTHTIKHLEDIF
jgi:putative endonuclease